MADTKSLQTLIAEVKTFIRTKNRSLDVSSNSLINDIILTPYGVAGKLLMDQVEVAKNLHILSSLVDTDLDNEGTNYNKERGGGVYATVDLTFYATSKPTAEVVIPATAQAQTAGTAFSTPVTFTVDGESRFALADVDAYYSHDRDRYEFTCSATCDTIGTDGNVSANIISMLVGGVSQINGVSNLTAAVGGSDQEMDDDFRERIRLAKLGRCLNVSNGIKGYLSGLGFADSHVIRVEEAGYERASGVDAFVVDYSSEVQTDAFIYDPAQQRYYFTKRPVREVTVVRSAAIGTLSTSQYAVTIDSTSPMRRSIYAQDFIEFMAPLVVGDTLSVSYNYSSAISQAQATLNLPDNRVLTADILVKRAYPLSLFLSALLTLKANADGPSTRNKCRNALSQFLSSYRLGDDVQKSDLIIVLQQGYGDYPVDNVDAVTISSFYLLDEWGGTYTATNDIIAVGDKEHAIYGSATVV